MSRSWAADMTPEQQKRRRAAHAFADRGWFVQPLVPGTSRPMSCELCWSESAKYVPHRGIDDCPHSPDYCHSFYAATVDHQRIESWFDRFPNANVGIATEASNLVVVDCDSAAHGPITDPEWQLPGVNDGLDVLTTILEQYGAPWPTDTLLVWTPRDGMHAYWKRPAGLTVKSMGGRFGPSVDVKGAGAFIVAPTSSKPEGDYCRIGDVTDPTLAPKWLVDHLDKTGHIPPPIDRTRTTRHTPVREEGTSAYVAKAIELELEKVANCGANRNLQLFTSAAALGQLVGAGVLDLHGVHQALTAAAEHAGISPAEGKAQDTIRRGLAAGAHQPRTIPTGAQA